VTEPTPGPGADLKAAREGMQVSIREVADALNLPARVIEALEADDYDRLPPTVFTRGYLRSYARLLELPADELLVRYPEVTEEVEAVTAVRTGSHPVVARTRPLLGPLAIVAVLLVLVLVWLFTGGEEDNSSGGSPPPTAAEPVTSRDDTASATTTTTPVGGEPQTAAREESLLPAETQSEQPSGAAQPEPEPILQQEPVPQRVPPRETPVAAATGDTAVAAVAPTPSELAAAEPVTAAGVLTQTFREKRLTEFGDDRIVLRFTEDCWVEVKSLDGENLYSDLNRAGVTLELTGRAPFRVLLGYAPGASLEFNGEPIMLSRFSRNNVASLVLGQ